jgi:pimeloyl-ACP methyl ester carboxylesterase
VKRIRIGIVMAAVAFMWTASAFAQDAAPEAQAQAEKARQFFALEKEVTALFIEKKYDEVIAKCDAMMELLPEQAGPHYNKACALARQGKADAAIAELTLAVDRGFDQPVHMGKDPDFESLRADKRFEALVEKSRETELKRDGEPEPGAEMEGVRTIEDTPSGALRYRVRMSPKATRENPNRVIIWCHPNGSSSNALIEPLAPRFIEKGFALVVLTQKSWTGWSDRDIGRLVGGTLPALGKIDGLDIQKPVLMGFGSGGQLGLILWRGAPAQWGGLVVSSAYPLVTGMVEGQRRVGLMSPPPAEAKAPPVFVLMSAGDGGTRVWLQVAPAWRAAGVALRIDTIPGEGKGWLFGKFQLAGLDGWLSDVAAGKTPETPADPAAVGKPATTPTPGGTDEKPEPPDME